MGFKQAITEIDIFGSPFTVAMGVGNDTKKTFFGALFSLLLIGAALGYFVYLNYQYATDVMPKVTSSEKRIKDKISYDYSKLNLAFAVYVEDDDGVTQTITEYELGKGYGVIDYAINFKYFDDKAKKEQSQALTSKFCSEMLGVEDAEDLEVSTAQCLDISNISSEDLTKLKAYPKNLQGSDTELTIQINLCDKDPTTCPHNKEDIDKIYSDKTFFELTLSLEQLDPYNGSMSSKTMVFDWIFDKKLQINGQVQLVPSHATIKSGFLFSSDDDFYYFSDVSTSDSYKYFDTSPKTVSAIKVMMGGKEVVEIFQYPLYPTVLAQFGSILNVLLLVGLIAKLLSKSEISTYFMEQKLKDYYKTNAYKMLNENNNKEEKQKDANEIMSTNNQIQNNDMFTYLKQKFKVSALTNCIKSLLAETQEDFNKKKRSNRDIYEVLYYDSNKSGDIFELNRELITLRKAVSLLLTTEQYAAIKCCGSSIDDQIPFVLDRKPEGDKQKQAKVISMDDNKVALSMEDEQNLQQVKQQLNHLEQIAKVDYDQQYFESVFFNFYKEQQEGFSQYGEHGKKLNQRLLECLNRTYTQMSENDFTTKIQMKQELHLQTKQQSNPEQVEMNSYNQQ